MRNLENPRQSALFFSSKKSARDTAPVTLDGKNLPWVKKISHLGCTLESDNSMRTDLICKRGPFIGKANSLLQEFHYTSPETMFKLVDTYATSCYGSPLWDLTSNEAEKLYKSWNELVRNILDLD